MCSVCTFYVLLLYFGVNQRNISAEVDNNLSNHIYFLNILFHLKQKVAIFNLSSHPVINITATYCVLRVERAPLNHPCREILCIAQTDLFCNQEMNVLLCVCCVFVFVNMKCSRETCLQARTVKVLIHTHLCCLLNNHSDCHGNKMVKQLNYQRLCLQYSI